MGIQSQSSTSPVTESSREQAVRMAPIRNGQPAAWDARLGENSIVCHSGPTQQKAAPDNAVRACSDTVIDVSIIMPCLNEAQTLADCIRSAYAGVCAGGYVGQVIIADNGSTDGSQQIVRNISSSGHSKSQCGVHVVDVIDRGYGSALLGGIAAARGKYIVMADADGSYDFGEISRFVEKLHEGYDLVMGNRFAGQIMDGAMPWHHRYVGNPVLSGIGRLLYRPGCRDFHCGLRAFDREKINALHLRCTGMEFATEMVIRAAQNKLRITEIPITLHPDGRNRPPHLNSVRDGLRHLWAMARLVKQGGAE